MDDDLVLQFSRVTLPSGVYYDTGMWDVDFSLHAGDLMLVATETNHPRLPLADAAVGILSREQGKIFFLGEDWETMRPDESIARRGMTSRLFDEGGWVTNLSVAENVMLSQRHHTRRSDTEIREEASQLARRFGLPGLPTGRPARVREHDLQRAACIRAFLGKPSMVLLERPTRGIYPHVMPALVNAIRSVRSRGGAVIWITDSVEVWNDPAINPTLKFQMSGSQMLLESEGVQ